MRKLSTAADRLLSRFAVGGTASAQAEKVCVPDPNRPDCEICTIYENGKPVLQYPVCFDTTRA